MKAPLFFTAALLLAPVASADAPLITARSRVEASHLSLLVGTHGVGLGFLLPRPPVPDARPTAFGGELLVHPGEGVLELRGSGQWQLSSGERAFSTSAQLGLTVLGVVRGPADLGLGPHAGFFVGLGGQHLEGFLGAQAGTEVFFRTGGPRFPLRGVLGARGRLGGLGLALTARAGVDLEHDLYATWRGDVQLSLDWYGTTPTETSDATAGSAPPRP
jgi:hypothetical protein